MQKLEVFGANKLKGQIKISGSKNASLPILAATLLSNKKINLSNVPKVKDIETMIELLRSLGSKIKFVNNKINIDNSNQWMCNWHTTCRHSFESTVKTWCKV